MVMLQKDAKTETLKFSIYFNSAWITKGACPDFFQWGCTFYLLKNRTLFNENILL